MPGRKPRRNRDLRQHRRPGALALAGGGTIIQGTLHRFANPARFQRIANTALPWLAAATAALLAFGLYFALFASPPDYQQGETVRIMYIHVPAAWMALFV